MPMDRKFSSRSGLVVPFGTYFIVEHVAYPKRSIQCNTVRLLMQWPDSLTTHRSEQVVIMAYGTGCANRGQRSGAISIAVTSMR